VRKGRLDIEHSRDYGVDYRSIEVVASNHDHLDHTCGASLFRISSKDQVMPGHFTDEMPELLGTDLQ
jgi:metal-dependent hydrolase (beta-lactamase superfamily II)